MMRELYMSKMGNDISPDEVVAFLSKVNKTEILYGTPEVRHARNLVSAYSLVDTMLAQNHEFSEQTFKDLQKIIARDITHIPFKFKGEYAVVPKEIRGTASINPAPLLEYPRIPQEMEKLGADFGKFMKSVYQNKLNVVELIDAASNFHWRLAFIHPFADGNGRLARLLSDAILQGGGLAQTPSWVDERKVGKADRKTPYFNSLKDSIRNQSNKPLGIFLAVEQLRALDIMSASISNTPGAFKQARQTGELERENRLKITLNRYIQPNFL